MKRLSKRQRDIIVAIQRYVEGKGYPPTYRELSEMVGLKSVSTVSGHLDRLKVKGYVSFIPGAPRTLTVNGSVICEQAN